MPTDQPADDFFASSSVPVHVVRGVIGLAIAIASFAYAPAHPWALLGLIVTAVAWRGCPTCWALGLAQTISRGKVACADDCAASPRRQASGQAPQKPVSSYVQV